MKTVLVTGATGFLGKHLVERLKAEDDSVRVRALCRGFSPWDNDPAVEVMRGNVIHRAEVDHAVEGVSEIYHLAGFVSRNPADQELLYQTHIEGTRNICESAAKHGVERLVLVSSSGTVAVSRDPVIHKEDSGYKNDVVGEWPYYLSKIFAEKLAIESCSRTGLPMVIANPSLLLGPGDDRNSSTRDVALFLEGQIMGMPAGGLNFVDVRDVAPALLAVMRSGRPGERYLLGGANWSFRRLIERVGEIAGKKIPSLKPSLNLSLWSTRALRRLYPLFGKSFELDEASVKMSWCFWYCDSGKAYSELGFHTRDPEETLKDTVEDVFLRLYRSGRLRPSA